MREILTSLNEWFAEGKQVALATVVKVYGSAPRSLGAKMAVNQDGLMVGSVSGGCVEGAVVAEALEILQSGQAKLLTYGISDDQAFNVGLACGGTIEVYVSPFLTADFHRLQADLLNERLTCIVRAISGEFKGEQLQVYANGEQVGAFSSATLNKICQEELQAVFAGLQPLRKTIAAHHVVGDLFFDIYPPSPRLIVVGAVHIAIPLIHFAKRLGFHTIVVDPRKAFNNRDRFPHVDELIAGWPQEVLPALRLNEGAYLVVISHDDKLDVPALALACASPARYIGALGSRKTFNNHLRDLRAMDITESDLQRIHSPVGLDLGARGAEEIALAIIAEIIAVKNNKK